MITFCARNYPSVHGKISVAAVGKNMVKASMHIHANVVKGKVPFRSSTKCSIKEGRETRLEVWPGMMSRRGRGGGTVQDWIWVGVPVPRKEVKGGEIRGLSGKSVEKGVASRASSRGVNVDNRKGSPLVAKCRR